MNSERIQKLIEILDELAPDLDRAELHRRAETIVVAAGIQAARHNAVTNEVGKYEARCRLKKLNELAVKVGFALEFEALGTEAFRAVNVALKRNCYLKVRYLYSDRSSLKRIEIKGPPDLQSIQVIVSQLCDTTKTAHEKLGAMPNKSPRVGRRKKEHSVQIAKRSITQFEQLTGKRAGRSTRNGNETSEFVSFVGRVFQTCGIDASPATAAEALRMVKNLTAADKTP